MARKRLLSSLLFALSFVILAVVFLTPVIPSVRAQADASNQSDSSSKVVVYFFWGDGCPHCAKAKPFLEELAKRTPQMELRAYEVWNNEDNFNLLKQMAQAQGFEVSGVPTFFIGSRHFVGYNDTISQQLEAAVQTCLKNTCSDAGAGIVPGVPAESAQETPAQPEQDLITLPLIGTIDLSGQSLWISTLLISFVDGFNPCSLWVLSILLALTLHTGSRKKVLIIGLIFLTVTAGVYALFIAGLFTVLRIVSFVGWIQVAVALIALFFGLVNVKDYFFYKEGLSFTIDDKQKPGIYQRMRRVLDASQSFWGLAGATVVMSAGVSLVEFSCTAGFPVLWTNIVAAQKVSALTFALLLLLYLIIYQIDEMAIFLTAVFTLKASRMEEKHGRILKLIGGMLMLTLAGVMVVNPRLMNDLGSSLIIFGVAFAAAGLVLLLHRKILPAFGIWIGSEKNARSR
jgi:thiol-disulfide isomerase/thioredoxin